MVGALAAHREAWLASEKVHFRWDKTLAPALAIRSGDVVHLQTRDVSGGQITLGAPASVAASLDTSKTYPLAGPIMVEDALPGDVLEVEMLELRPGAWGWTAIIPGRGLLATDFDQPYIRYFALTDLHRAELRPGISISLAPFCGTIGVAPDRSEPTPVRPPHEGGGNIDDRRLTEGSKLYLPVQVKGALLSVGDCHAAQGDGEVCLTGLECDMQVTLRVSAIRGRQMPPWTHQVITAHRPAQTATAEICMAASGPDLMENARTAIREMISWLEQQHDLSREDAYVLCSLAADLRIGQIVNVPNWTVSACLPLSVFGASLAAGTGNFP